MRPKRAALTAQATEKRVSDEPRKAAVGCAGPATPCLGSAPSRRCTVVLEEGRQLKERRSLMHRP